MARVKDTFFYAFLEGTSFLAGLWCCVQRGDMRSGDPPLEQRGWVVAFVRYVGPTRALRQVIMLCMRQPKGYLLVMQRRTTLYHPHATPYHPVPPSRNAVPPCITPMQRRTTLYHPHAAALIALVPLSCPPCTTLNVVPVLTCALFPFGIPSRRPLICPSSFRCLSVLGFGGRHRFDGEAGARQHGHGTAAE